MFPATFAPYLIKLIAPKLTEKIANHIAKAFKLPQLVNYMELPNDADKGVEKLMVENEMLKSQIKDITNEINKIKNKFEKVKKIRAL